MARHGGIKKPHAHNEELGRHHGQTQLEQCLDFRPGAIRLRHARIMRQLASGVTTPVFMTSLIHGQDIVSLTRTLPVQSSSETMQPAALS